MESYSVSHSTLIFAPAIDLSGLCTATIENVSFQVRMITLELDLLRCNGELLPTPQCWLLHCPCIELVLVVLGVTSSLNGIPPTGLSLLLGMFWECFLFRYC